MDLLLGDSYTSAKFYKHIHSHIVVPKVFSWIWRSCCIMKSKVFAWLLLTDRLNTKDLLKRRNWNVTEDYCCVLCRARVYEDKIHLFFNCTFSSRIWNYLQIEWPVHGNRQAVMAGARRRFGHHFFMEVVIIACWHIWLLRNDVIFNHERHTFGRWKCNFVHVLSLLKHMMKTKHLTSFSFWIGSLP